MRSKTDPPLDVCHIEQRMGELEERILKLERAAPCYLYTLAVTWARERGRFAFADLCKAVEVPADRAIRRAVAESLRAAGFASYNSRGRVHFKRA